MGGAGRGGGGGGAVGVRVGVRVGVGPWGCVCRKAPCVCRCVRAYVHCMPVNLGAGACGFHANVNPRLQNQA